MGALLATLQTTFQGAPAWLWLAFAGIVAALLMLDMGVLHKDEREIGVKESILLSAGYIGVALAFGAGVWLFLGAHSALAYFNAYLIEKSLSMDNVFVISLTFTYFAIPRQYQHRVLFAGVLGVIVLRAAMIGLGATLLNQFNWILYAFGAFLVFTGIRMWINSDRAPDIAHNPLLKFLRKRLRIVPEVRSNSFFAYRADAVTGKPRRWVTPLFLALCLVELFDLVF